MRHIYMRKYISRTFFMSHECMFFFQVENNKEEKKNQIKVVAMTTHLIFCFRHTCRHHDDGDKFIYVIFKLFLPSFFILSATAYAALCIYRCLVDRTELIP